MYKLKPVFAVPLEISSACPMYKLKNLLESPVNVFNKSDKDLCDDIKLSDQDIDSLLKEQNKVLNTLEQLELRLSKLNIQYPVNTKDNEPTQKNQSNLAQSPASKKYQKIPPSEINSNIAKLISTDSVIFADPENPPYSLLALPILWPSVSWNISYHVHSSITCNSKATENTKVFKNVTCKSDKSTVQVFVIWQHVTPSPKVVRSPTSTLVGEVPLLRLFDQHLATEKLIAADQTKTNKVLDLINEISCSTNNRTSEMFNLINLGDTTLDVENVAIWSVLYKKNINAPKIDKWLEQMEKIIIS